MDEGHLQEGEPDLNLLGQALDPSVCFLCAEEVSKYQRSREHVFPRWMQQEFDLWDARMTLLNGTTLPYRQLTVTACRRCNNEVLSSLESEVARAFLAGPDAVRALDEERLFLWLGKFYYGLFFRELSLAIHRRNPDAGAILASDELRNYGIHHLLLRRLLGQIEWSDFPASIFILEALVGDEAEANFDYADSFEQPFVALRCGRTYVAAMLQDFGATKLVAESFPQLTTASALRLHHLQCTELTSLFLTIVRHHRPAKMVVMSGQRDKSWVLQVLPRGGLSGRSSFETWDSGLQETMLRAVMNRQLGLTFQASANGMPTLLIDGNGSPFQAPSFSWMPDEAPRSGEL